MKPALLAVAVLPLLGALPARAEPKTPRWSGRFSSPRPDILPKARTAAADARADQQFSALKADFNLSVARAQLLRALGCG
jgi:hypothetical protein